MGGSFQPLLDELGALVDELVDHFEVVGEGVLFGPAALFELDVGLDGGGDGIDGGVEGGWGEGAGEGIMVDLTVCGREFGDLRELG